MATEQVKIEWEVAEIGANMEDLKASKSPEEDEGAEERRRSRSKERDVT